MSGLRSWVSCATFQNKSLSLFRGIGKLMRIYTHLSIRPILFRTEFEFRGLVVANDSDIRASCWDFILHSQAPVNRVDKQPARGLVLQISRCANGRRERAAAFAARNLIRLGPRNWHHRIVLC